MPHIGVDVVQSAQLKPDTRMDELFKTREFHTCQL